MEDQGDYFPLGKWQAENSAAERPCHSTVGDTDKCVCSGSWYGTESRTDSSSGLFNMFVLGVSFR